jgi:hypothetical protein
MDDFEFVEDQFEKYSPGAQQPQRSDTQFPGSQVQGIGDMRY